MKYLIMLFPACIWKEVSEERYNSWRGSKRMGLLPIHKGESVTFNYHSKSVICKVVRIDNDGFVGELQTDYIGKNESSFIGETKWFRFNIVNK